MREKMSNPHPHHLQVQKALALLYSKLVGQMVLEPITKSYIPKLESVQSFAAMTTAEPAVSLQCCKSLIERIFNQGEIRTKQQ